MPQHRHMQQQSLPPQAQGAALAAQQHVVRRQAPPARGSATLPRFRPSAFMQGRDIFFAVSAVLKALETGDNPYVQDFYFLQYVWKHSARWQAAAAQRHGGVPMPLVYVAMPRMHHDKERLLAKRAEGVDVLNQRIRSWEGQFKVLGHTERSAVHRPRALLSFAGVGGRVQRAEAEAEAQAQAQGTDDAVAEDPLLQNQDGQPFTSMLWLTRRAIQNAYDAFLTAQELHELLKMPLDAIKQQRVQREMGMAIAHLGKALGVEMGPHIPQGGVAIDAALVTAIIALTKGRRIIARCLTLLAPPQQWELIMIVLAQLLQQPVDTTDAAALQLDQQLFQTVRLSVEGIAQHVLDLPRLCHCLHNVMLPHTSGHADGPPQNRLREALISSQPRAELMHRIVEFGDHRASMVPDPNAQAEWGRLRNTFMTLLAPPPGAPAGAAGQQQSSSS